MDSLKACYRRVREFIMHTRIKKGKGCRVRGQLEDMPHSKWKAYSESAWLAQVKQLSGTMWRRKSVTERGQNQFGKSNKKKKRTYYIKIYLVRKKSIHTKKANIFVQLKDRIQIRQVSVSASGIFNRSADNLGILWQKTAKTTYKSKAFKHFSRLFIKIILKTVKDPMSIYVFFCIWLLHKSSCCLHLTHKAPLLSSLQLSREEI